MTEYLETTLGKFIFKVATDRLYSGDGLWAKAEERHIRIGVSDFLQQRSGDVAFVEVKPVGTQLTAGTEIATLETIKVTLSLVSPLSGQIIEVNPILSAAPEVINQDPYESGWLAIVAAEDWEVDKTGLLDPQTYFKKMKLDAEREAGQ